MLFENQICFLLDHFVFTFEFNIWGKDSELFYLTQIPVGVLCSFSLFRSFIHLQQYSHSNWCVIYIYSQLSIIFNLGWGSFKSIHLFKRLGRKIIIIACV